MKTNSYAFLFLILTILLLSQSQVIAIPSFARQTNMACSSCHTMFPELNAFGRMFKLNGYTLTGIETIQSSDKNDNTKAAEDSPGVVNAAGLLYIYQ